MAFEGIPTAALDFYEDLEADNSKAFWTAHKQVYDQQVKAPMEALAHELGRQFGEAKLFRPYRDVRFSKVNLRRGTDVQYSVDPPLRVR